jgi:sugar phosphate permease
MLFSRLPGTLSALVGERRGRVLASVAVGWLLVLGMRFVVPGVLPTITGTFEATGAEAGLAITVLWITYALMQFPAGFYLDRLSERVLLAASLFISAGALTAYLFTPTYSLFVVATGLFGLGTGLYGTPRGTVISKTYDERDATAFGVMLSVGSVGAAALPALAALLVAEVGWRVTLGGAAPAFLAAAVAIWMVVPDTRVPSEGTDSLEAVLGSV